MQPINSDADVQAGLRRLLKLDPRLQPVARLAGPLPLRRRAADFRGLAQIVVAQQVSVASARAIFGRLEGCLPSFDPGALAAMDDVMLTQAGLSRPKIRTLRAVAAALEAGLDLADLAGQPAEAAHRELCAIPGIGPWSADIFLLFCAGHPDVFPAGDLALREALRGGLCLAERPTAARAAELAAAWQPWRAIAARLFWAYYAAVKQGRATLPL